MTFNWRPQDLPLPTDYSDEDEGPANGLPPSLVRDAKHPVQTMGRSWRFGLEYDEQAGRLLHKVRLLLEAKGQRKVAARGAVDARLRPLMNRHKRRAMERERLAGPARVHWLSVAVDTSTGRATNFTVTSGDRESV